MKYRSLKDIVYDYISVQIRTQKLKPGEKINENQICDALEISRTPVREALIQLSNEGCIEQIPRRGFVVREIKVERANNIYEIIGALEALAFIQCLDKKEAVDLPFLGELVDRMDARIMKGQYDEYYQLQNVFHDVFIQASENEDLIRILGSLKRTLIKQSYNGTQDEASYREALKLTNEEHRQILTLFEAGDREALRRFVRDIHWNVRYAEMEILI